ncbi:MAG: hypothetical protein F4038_03520 [Chloroflexi bacterium]|nr:hypothetical protein [Chloroflexota bacterium]MYG90353.1 hypothetical protein [Chloroflexota bacterium]MYJ92107.1 hypothetical protein [Chloroflexota bacterium]
MTTIHGGLDTAELRRLGLLAEEVIDYSARISPLGTSGHVRRAGASVDLSSYPDRDCLDLRGRLAEWLGVGTDHLLIGNGSAEQAIRQVCLDLVLLCNPNNPTGLYLDRASVNRIRAAIPPGRLLVLDDGYRPLSDDLWDSTPLLDADTVRTVLLRLGITVRNCASFGLPGQIRVAVRVAEECAQLVSAPRQVLGR